MRQSYAIYTVLRRPPLHEVEMRALVLASVALFAASCFPRKTIEVGGFGLAQTMWEEDEVRLTHKGSFDLDCPAAKVELVVLDASQYFDFVRGKTVFASSVGVRGCGKKITYANINDEWFGPSED